MCHLALLGVHPCLLLSSPAALLLKINHFLDNENLGLLAFSKLECSKQRVIIFLYT